MQNKRKVCTVFPYHPKSFLCDYHGIIIIPSSLFHFSIIKIISQLEKANLSIIIATKNSQACAS